MRAGHAYRHVDTHASAFVSLLRQSYTRIVARVYGSAVVCYEDGLFDFLGDTPLHSTGGLHWMVPCVSSILLLALALEIEKNEKRAK